MDFDCFGSTTSKLVGEAPVCYPTETLVEATAIFVIRDSKHWAAGPTLMVEQR